MAFLRTSSRARTVYTPRLAAAPASSVRHRIGTVLFAVCALVAVGFAASAAILTYPRLDSTDTSKRPRATSTAEVLGMLNRVGLDAGALAAAGCTSQQATAVGAAMQAHLALNVENMQAIREADMACHDARSAASRATRDVRAGVRSPERANLAAARSAAEQASATLDGLLAAALAFASASLTPEQRAAVAAIHANRRWELPLQYLVVDRPASDWAALRNALAAVNYAATHRATVNTSAQRIVTAADNQAATVAARSGLDNSREAIEQALQVGATVNR